MADSTKAYYEFVTEHFVKLMQAGEAPWQKPQQGVEVPYNTATGRGYNGVNSLLLLSSGYSDPRWMGYNQAEQMEAQVRYEEKATKIIMPVYEKFIAKVDDAGNPILKTDGQQAFEKVKLEHPEAKLLPIFNAEQVDGLKPIDKSISISAHLPAYLKNAEDKMREIASALGGNPPKEASTENIQGFLRGMVKLGMSAVAQDKGESQEPEPHGTVEDARRNLSVEIASLMLGLKTGLGYVPTAAATAKTDDLIKLFQDTPAGIHSLICDADKATKKVLDAVAQGQGFAYVYTELENREPKVYRTPLSEFYANCDRLHRDEDTVIYEKTTAGEALRKLGEVAPKELKNLPEDQDVYRADYYPDMLEASIYPYATARLDKHNAYMSYIMDSNTSPEIKKEVLCAFYTSYDRLHKDADTIFYANVEPGWTNNASSRKKITPAEAKRVLETFSTYDEFKSLPFDLEMQQFMQSNNSPKMIDSVLSEFYANCDKLHTDEDTVIFEKTTAGEALRKLGELAPKSLKNLPEEHEVYRADYYIPWRAMAKEIYPYTPARINKHNAYLSYMNSDARPETVKSVSVWRFSDDDAAVKALHGNGNQAEKNKLESILKAVAPRVLDEYEQKIQTKTEMQINAKQETMTQEHQQPQTPASKEYLAVPYAEKNLAKSAGALWDKEANSWYKGPNAEHDLLARYAIKEGAVQKQQITPQEEFGQVLISTGCILDGPPVMDGNKQRVAVQGDNGTQKSGFYVGHLDGIPTGYIMNNRTGAEARWHQKGYVLTDEEKAQMQALSALKMQEYRAERERQYMETAKVLQNKIKQELTPAVGAEVDPPYLVKKGLFPTAGTYVDKEKALIVPAIGTDGEIRTIQYIDGKGTKLFAVGGQKASSFHVVDAQPEEAMEKLSDARVIIIAEGYATAASIQKAMLRDGDEKNAGLGVVAAFDSGNLKPVAMALLDKFPDKPIIIAADDDKHLLNNPQVNRNIGKDKAYEAAKAVNATVVIPVFASGEQDKNPKNFTDFNDMMKSSSLGITGVKKQIQTGVLKAFSVKKKQNWENVQNQERLRPMEQAQAQGMSM
jgi:phage/plasmid primase-like uncharacterized protein/antirestriction protein ArdC